MPAEPRTARYLRQPSQAAADRGEVSVP
jgi:hypothetical protein